MHLHARSNSMSSHHTTSDVIPCYTHHVANASSFSIHNVAYRIISYDIMPYDKFPRQELRLSGRTPRARLSDYLINRAYYYYYYYYDYRAIILYINNNSCRNCRESLPRGGASSRENRLAGGPPGARKRVPQTPNRGNWLVAIRRSPLL